MELRPLDLWSDNKYRTPVIYGDEIKAGGDYHVWLKYVETSNKTGDLSYYLYESGTYPATWRHIKTIEDTDLSSIKSVPILVSGGNVDEMSCSTDETIPELPELPLPNIELDICHYVPEEVQSNAYPAGLPFGQLAITWGTDSVINVQNNKTAFAFNRYAGGVSCNYPGGSATCKYDPTKTFESYPPVLGSFNSSDRTLTCEDNCILSHGENYDDITIKDGARLQLTQGEYWFGNIDFQGPDSGIEISGNVIVHYQSMQFNSGVVEINTTGFNGLSGQEQ